MVTLFDISNVIHLNIEDYNKKDYNKLLVEVEGSKIIFKAVNVVRGRRQVVFTKEVVDDNNNIVSAESIFKNLSPVEKMSILKPAIIKVKGPSGVSEELEIFDYVDKYVQEDFESMHQYVLEHILAFAEIKLMVINEVLGEKLNMKSFSLTPEQKDEVIVSSEY